MKRLRNESREKRPEWSQKEDLVTNRLLAPPRRLERIDTF
jgi:hypothetical protein